MIMIRLRLELYSISFKWWISRYLFKLLFILNMILCRLNMLLCRLYYLRFNIIMLLLY